MGRFADSITTNDAFLAVRPDYTEGLFCRGIAKIRSGDVSGGQADIASAKKAAPGIEAYFAGLGITP